MPAIVLRKFLRDVVGELRAVSGGWNNESGFVQVAASVVDVEIEAGSFAE